MEDMMSSQNMNYNNSSYGGLLSGLLVLLIKLLVLLLIVSIIIGIAVWLKNNFLKNINFSGLMNQNPLLKAIVGILAIIIGLVFLIYIFNYLTGRGSGFSYGINYGMGSVNGYYGYNSGLGLTGAIALLLKALIFIFFVTLIISMVAYLAKYLGINNFHSFHSNNTNSKTFSGNENSNQAYTDKFNGESDEPVI